MHTEFDKDIALALSIMDGLFWAEGGKTKGAMVFDNAIRMLRRIQEFGCPQPYLETYNNRREEHGLDLRRVPIS